MKKISQSTDYRVSDLLGRHIAHALDAVSNTDRSNAQQRDAYREAVVATMQRRQGSRLFTAKAVAIGVAAILLTTIGIGVWRFFPLLQPNEKPIGFRIGNGAESSHPGAWVKNTDAEMLPIIFENGSQFELQSGSAARVVSASQESVHLDLNHGAIHASVNGNGHTRWQITAGPYAVTVIGTVFDVHWDSEGTLFSVSVLRGAVAVADADAGYRNMKVSAGQRFVSENGRIQMAQMESAAAGKRSTDNDGPHRSVAPETTSPENSDAPHGTTVTPPNPTRLHPPAAPPGHLPQRVSPDASASASPWQAPLAQKNWDAVLPFLKGANTARIAAATDEASLWELANWLRHQRHPRISGTLLETYRQRYPGTERAATAAFLLGKSALDQTANPRRAVHWLQIYLAESPNGFLREEALGRLVLLAESSENPQAFKSHAAEYLKQFPKGPYASSAKRLLKR